MNSIYDVFSGHARQTYSGGRYYKELPLSHDSDVSTIEDQKPKLFDYEIVNPYERRYTRVFGNVVSNNGADLTVSTKTRLDFEPNSYVALKDGYLYQIRDVREDLSETSKEAARLLIVPFGAAKLLQLLRVADPYGIGGRR